MYYTPWKISDSEEYKLRLTTMQAMQVEKQLGRGMGEIAEHLADATTITVLLWGAMQPLNHGTSLKDVCDIYDRYLENGGNVEKTMDVMVDLLAQVGYGDRKNATSQKATADVLTLE